MKFSATLAVAAATVVAGKASDQPIVMKGSKLFYENGTQFFIKGMAYQQDTAAAGATNTKTDTYKDPLADAASCKRDVPLLQQLDINTIRTYAINPNEDHSTCMQLLDEAGIYVISDLSEPSLSINRASPVWDTELYARYTSVVKELGQYKNVIGFFAGNEVSNNASNTDASAFVKAAVRDIKQYIKTEEKRWMGVGYAANDDENIRANIADYFNCGQSEDRIDFWGYNIYSWCDPSDMQTSGYNTELEFFKDYSVPVFFAEYGCNKNGGAAGRKWEETTALYYKNMTEVFSGGIVYMYFEEQNDFGVVKVSGTKATKLKDFDVLAEKNKAAKPTGVSMKSYSSSNKASTCPTVGKTWNASSLLPPTPDASSCSCMVKAASCVPASGLKAKDYGDIFGYICGKKPAACKGIKADASKGVYGAYSMCETKDQLTYVLNQYYLLTGKSSDSCDFNGQATTQTGANDGSCQKALASASSINAQVATATANAGGQQTGSTTSSGSSSSSSSGSGSAGVPSAAVSLYMVLAGAFGAGMMLL